MPASDFSIGFRRLTNEGKEFRRIQIACWRRGLERNDPAEDFPTIQARHPHGSNFTRSLVEIEVRSMAHIRAPIREIDCALGVFGKLRQERWTGCQNLKGLANSLCHLPRHPDILGFAEHAAEGVAGQ